MSISPASTRSHEKSTPIISNSSTESFFWRIIFDDIDCHHATAKKSLDTIGNFGGKFSGVPFYREVELKNYKDFSHCPCGMLKRFGFPFLKRGSENEFNSGDILYLVIDRTQWANVNLLMISFVYNRRAIPIYFTLLGKLGNTNATEQKWFLEIALDLLKDYPQVILGDTTTSG